MISDDGVGPLGTYIDSELGYEWQRKTSFESRAFSTVTANLGFVTLFFAISAQEKLLASISTGASHGFLIAALVAVAVSIALSVLAALPGNYAAPTADALDALYKSAKRTTDSADVRDQIVEARLVQLRAAVSTNHRKAFFSVSGFLALAVAALCLSFALGYAF